MLFWPKKWIFRTFFLVNIFLKHSILIICHVSHFSFSKLSLNVPWNTLSAISAPSNFTPMDARFFWFLLCFDFFKLYVEKNNNIAVVDNVPGNVFCLFFPEPQSFGRFGPFSEAKVKFLRSQMLVENAQKHVFF